MPDPADADSLNDGHETQVIEQPLLPGEAAGPAAEADGLVDWDVGLEAETVPEEGDFLEADQQPGLDDPILDAVLPEPEVLTLAGEDPLEVAAEEAPATPENCADPAQDLGQKDPAGDQVDEPETTRTRGTLPPVLATCWPGDSPTAPIPTVRQKTALSTPTL